MKNMIYWKLFFILYLIEFFKKGYKIRIIKLIKEQSKNKSDTFYIEAQFILVEESNDKYNSKNKIINYTCTGNKQDCIFSEFIIIAYKCFFSN